MIVESNLQSTVLNIRANALDIKSGVHRALFFQQLEEAVARLKQELGGAILDRKADSL
jgi:hypothetical protein